MKTLLFVFSCLFGFWVCTIQSFADSLPSAGTYSGVERNNYGIVVVSFKLTDGVAFDSLKGEIDFTGDPAGGKATRYTFKAHYDPRTNQILASNVSNKDFIVAGSYSPGSKSFSINVSHIGLSVQDEIVAKKSGVVSIAGNWTAGDGTIFHITRQRGRSYKAVYHGAATHSQLVGTLVGEFDGEVYAGKLQIKEDSISAQGTFNFAFISGRPRQLVGSLGSANNIDHILRTYPTTLTK